MRGRETQPERLGDNHLIEIGSYIGATENQATQVFRTFTADEIRRVYAPLLSDATLIRDRLVSDVSYSHYYYRSVFKPIPPEIADLVNTKPDIAALADIISWFEGDLLVEQYPDRFRQIIDKPDESIQRMKSSSIGGQIDVGAEGFLKLNLLVAFTPMHQREKAFIKPIGFKGRYRKHELKQIVQHTPDLSPNDSPEQRFEAFTQMLAMTHTDAVHIIAGQEGLSPEVVKNLRKDDPAYVSLQRRAGRYLMEQSLPYVYLDSTGTGYGSLFTVHPKTHRRPANTERRRCPASSLVTNYFQGVGQALKENREAVLSVISEIQYPLLSATKPSHKLPLFSHLFRRQ